MKTLPLDWIEDIMSNAYGSEYEWNPNNLAIQFFNHLQAEIDLDDGALYTGRSWANEDQTQAFYEWVNGLGETGTNS